MDAARVRGGGGQVRATLDGLAKALYEHHFLVKQFFAYQALARPCHVLYEERVFVPYRWIACLLGPALGRLNSSRLYRALKSNHG
jgi:hypothetical protein